MTNKNCEALGTGGPIVLWGKDMNRGQDVEELKRELDLLVPGSEYTLASFNVDNWNADFSPWPAEVDGQRFAGNGPETLKWLETEVVPYLRNEHPEAGKIFIAGYSLAGLFGLWAAHETSLFDGVVCCSGSLWYPGWNEYAATHKLKKDIPVYISLGGKEKNNRSPLLSTIEDETKLQVERLQERNVPALFELNAGGHFADPMGRLAKGIASLL